MIHLQLNGRSRQLASPREMPLLWALREEAGLAGTKYGCGIGVCGVCTVHVDGQPVKSCQITLAEAEGKAVTTIEGLAAEGHPVIDAWIDEQVPQCGYCQPAMVMTAAAVLARPNVSQGTVDRTLSEVLCRCGSYTRVRRAVARLRAGTPSEPHRSGPAPSARSHRLNPWVAIGEDGTVTVRIDRAEMGQGAATGTAVLVAEELEVDLAQVRTEFAPVDPAYTNPLFGNQSTGGSTSVRGSFDHFRAAGAAAREMLVAAAAQRWGVAVAECRAEAGAVHHRPSNRVLTYGALAAEAAKRRPPSQPQLKSPDAFRLIGKPTPRLELPAHVRGETVYGIDVRLPGLVHAAVRRPSRKGMTVERCDDSRAKQLPGVLQVLRIDAGVAVVAETSWAAFAARDALQVTWRIEGAGALSQLMRRSAASLADGASMAKQMDEALQRDGRAVKNVGDVDAAFAEANVTEAVYATPFQVHAPMEPMNCTVRLDAKGGEVWAATQSPEDVRKETAAIAGLPESAIQVHPTFAGGSFGRRMDSDFVIEAVQIAKAAGRPVHLLWSRDDDMRHGSFRPANRARARGAIRGGRIEALSLKLAGPALALGGAYVLYDIPNYREEHVRVNVPVNLGAWRAVGASQNAFIVEGFVDELAHAAGEDPLAFRVAHLAGQPRLRGVLELAAHKAGWGRTPEGRGRGIACYRSFGSYVAIVAEVSVRPAGTIRVDRVVVAADCGTVVNPDAVAAQMEGSVVFALGATLLSEITFREGAAEQSSFIDYPIIRYAESPAIEVHLVTSREAPGGAGEPGVPPVAPAVANAVFAATGKRARSLPIRF